MDEIMNVTDKTPIEIALKIDDEGFTTASKLFEWLNLDSSQYARWVKDNITKNPFAEEWEFSTIMSKTSERGGRPKQDYKVHASLAKKIAMSSRTERGKEARNYFIGCEQALKRVAEQKRQTELERAKGIAVRQALTNAIKVSGENERMHGHAYSTYTDVIYKALFGKSAKQLREENGISKKDSLRDLFAEEDLKKIQNAEMLVSSLVGFGWGYDDIKAFVTDRATMKITDKSSEL